MYVMSGNGQNAQSHSQNSAATFTVFGYMHTYITAVIYTYVRRCVLYVQSNLSTMNPLRATETVCYVHYIRVFTTSEFIYNRINSVHSKVYVCYIREFIVSRVHYSGVQLYYIHIHSLNAACTYICTYVCMHVL